MTTLRLAIAFLIHAVGAAVGGGPRERVPTPGFQATSARSSQGRKAATGRAAADTRAVRRKGPRAMGFLTGC